MSTFLLEDQILTWRLTGELTLTTVPSLLSELAKQTLFPQVVDLGEVTHSDSAGVALLIELIRQARDRTLTFHHVPAQILSIATVCGVQAFFTP